jgi:predicted AlkP superfamily phosphohydrolase/phosphomutase
MRVLIIGLDAFDPNTFERLYERGRMPNLGKYVQLGGYSRFAVSNPPQSEVSWTSIATGLNPGGHGMFDFVHRNPANYALNVSLLPTQKGLAGTQFAYPYNARTIFDQTVSKGYPATVLWWPAMFPARIQSPVQSIPGLGTPDLLGRLGVGTLFTTNPEAAEGKERKTPVALLKSQGTDSYTGLLPGPMRKGKSGVEAATVDLQIEKSGTNAARVRLGKHTLDLQVGQWSPIVEISFKMGFLFSMKALTQLILTQVQPDVQLYVSPLQIHPLSSPWHYATPRGFVKKTWNECGPFLTVGWPQDTTALEDGFIGDAHFLDLCESIDRVREKILMYHLDHFKEGVLATVFDTLDRVQHMFFRDRPDIIDEWYVRLDDLIGRIVQKLNEKGIREKTKIVILSDHGFSEFSHKAHLNRWLLDQGYLAPKETKEAGHFGDVEWSKSQAYAIGLNSIYLNQVGREGKGIVETAEREAILRQLCDNLLQWRGTNGRSVVQKVWRQNEAFEGPLASYGPDIMVGFAPGFRASSQTGLGGWEKESLEPNNDHWGADHCINPEAVPGVIFTNQGLKNYPNPSYRDIPAITIGSTPDSSSSTPPPTSSGTEDEKVIEERLKSLGYL